MSMHPRIRRVLRVIGILIGVILGLAVLAMLMLLVRPVRELTLQELLGIASDRLPGTLQVENSAWPGLSRIELYSVIWQDGEERLAAAERIALDLDLRALVREDLHVRALLLDGLEVDGPRIQAAFGSDPPTPTDPDDSGEPGFPREGALPGIPSVSVDSLRLDLVRLDAAEDVTVTLAVAMALDMQANHTPVVSIHSLDGSWVERDWTFQSDGLDVAIASGEFKGTINADFADQLALDLELENTGPREFRMVLTERGSIGHLLQLDGSFTQRPNGMIDVLDYDLELRSLEATRIEEIIGRPDALDPVEQLGQVFAEASGSASLTDTVHADATVVVTAREWSGRIDARLRQTGSRIDLDDLSVEAEGLSITASGAYAPDEYSGELEATVSGTGFLAGLIEAEGIPEDLRARLQLALTGEGSAVRPSLQLSGSAPSSGLDSLRVEAYGKVDGPDSDLRVDVASLLRDQLAIGLDARVRDLEQPRVSIAPVRVRGTLAQLDNSGGALPETPNLLLDPETRSVSFDELRITGGLGELLLAGELSRDSGGSARLRVDWPAPPDALGLLGFDAGARDSLLAPHWNRDGVPGIRARIEVPAGAQSANLEASIALPAPWTLIAGLDSTAYDAAHLRGTADATWSESGSWTAALDFAETAWLDSAFVHARGLGASAQLDSMLIRGGSVRATAAAQLDSNEIDGKFQLDLHSHSALALVLPDLPPDLDFMINLRAGIAGSPDAPDARAKLLASARSDALRLPLLSVEAELVEGVPQSARLEIPERASVSGLQIEHMIVAAQPQDPAEGLFPMWFACQLQGDAEWKQVSLIDSVGGTWSVLTDSLRIGAGGHVLESLQSFAFEFAPADSALRLAGLELAGDPGTVSASFNLGPGRPQADIDAHLDGSIIGELVKMPERMLPTGYHVVASSDQNHLEASLWVEGITLGTRSDIVARVDSRRSGNELEVKVHAQDPLGRLAEGSVVLPMTTDLVNRRFEWHDGPLSGTVEVDSLPLPYKIGGDQGISSYLLGARDEEAPLADALLLLGGTGSQPVVGARVGVGFPQIKELQDDRLELGAIWIGRDGDAATLGLFDEGMLERMRHALPHGGVAVLGTLDRGTRNLVKVRAEFPLTEDADSPFPGFAAEDPVLFSVSAEPLRLEEWQALLPRGTEVGGNVWIAADGDGPIGDFPLEASIRMERLRYRQSFGNSANLDGRIDVSGSSGAPVIKGVLTVPNALVRLPDSGRDLHPVSGDSKLWNLGLVPRDEFAALDSLEVEWGWWFELEDPTEVDEPRLTLAESTDLDVKIEIPNSFWIRGQGLEVQLAGKLHLELRQGVPIVVGELRALSGQLEVVGARLRLDRGVVTFYGGDTTNPGLDLELSRDVGDVKVFVRVTGTALDPRLTFDSDPPMSQSDIMSYLLFGSSASDLDGAQTQLLQDQAAAALSQFAAPMLESELTQSLGISMMQLRAGENPDEGLSLVVGSYVTPQILLKYEQSLKNRQKYTVNAEYWLTRNLRIETRLSQARSTGIELNWSTDY